MIKTIASMFLLATSVLMIWAGMFFWKLFHDVKLDPSQKPPTPKEWAIVVGMLIGLPSVGLILLAHMLVTIFKI